MLSRPLRIPGALVVLAGALLALWLALPRLAGLAAERWLDLPGVSGLAVRIESVTWREIRIASLRFRYELAAGDRAGVAARDVVLDIDFPRRHARRVSVGAAGLHLQAAAPAPGTPWPTLELPRLPLDELEIRQLQLRWPQAGIASLDGVALRLRQDHSLAIALEARHPALNLVASLAGRGDQVALDLKARRGPATVVQLRALASRVPTLARVRLRVVADLQFLPSWRRWLPVPAGLTDVAGSVDLDARVSLGEQVGAWRRAGGALALRGLRLGGALAAVEVDGSARFEAGAGAGHWPDALDLRGEPGTRVLVKMTDPELGGGEAVLDAPFSLRWQPGSPHALPGRVSSEDALRLRWQAPAWGDWDIGVSRLEFGPAASGRAEGRVALALQGGLPRLAAGPARADQLRIRGPVALAWSDGQSLRATAGAAAPLRITATSLTTQGADSWQLQAPAFDVRGELSLAVDGEAWVLDSADARLQGRALGARQGSTRLRSGPWTASLHLESGRWRGDWRATEARWQDADQQIGFLAPAVALRSLRPGGDASLGIRARELRHAALADWPAPALTAAVRKAGNALRFESALHRQQTELLTFRGSHQLGRQRGQAFVRWRHDLAELDRLLRPRPRPLASLGPLAGRDEGEATLTWTPGGAEWATTGSLRVGDADVQWDRARANGVKLIASLASLEPPRGRLELDLPEAGLAAGLTARDTRLELALDDEAVQIDALRTALLGGTLQAEPARLPIRPSGQVLRLRVQDLDLGQILALADADGLSGTGRLSGVVPLVYTRDGLEIRDGELAGTGPGTLKYAPPGVLADNLGLQALQDFRYQQMRATLQYHADGRYEIRLQLDGNNPALYGGYPIALKLNLNGALPGLFRAAVLSGDFSKYVLEQLRSGQLP